jgi:hypothetical protein
MPDVVQFCIAQQRCIRKLNSFSSICHVFTLYCLDSRFFLYIFLNVCDVYSNDQLYCDRTINYQHNYFKIGIVPLE